MQLARSVSAASCASTALSLACATSFSAAATATSAAACVAAAACSIVALAASAAFSAAACFSAAAKASALATASAPRHAASASLRVSLMFQNSFAATVASRSHSVYASDNMVSSYLMWSTTPLQSNSVVEFHARTNNGEHWGASFGVGGKKNAVGEKSASPLGSHAAMCHCVGRAIL